MFGTYLRSCLEVRVSFFAVCPSFSALPTHRTLIMDARRGIDLLRAVTASSALFIPVLQMHMTSRTIHFKHTNHFIPFVESSTPYREILMEGVYSLSQLMGLANHSFFNPAHRTSR